MPSPKESNTNFKHISVTRIEWKQKTLDTKKLFILKLKLSLQQKGLGFKELQSQVNKPEKGEKKGHF